MLQPRTAAPREACVPGSSQHQPERAQEPRHKLRYPFLCRRHISLLRSLTADASGHSVMPLHTILEVFRVQDLSLRCVIPSPTDEVNAAAFHPLLVSHLTSW